MRCLMAFGHNAALARDIDRRAVGSRVRKGEGVCVFGWMLAKLILLGPGAQISANPRSELPGERAALTSGCRL